MSLRGGGKQAGCTGPTASRLLVAQQEAGGGPWPLIKGSLEQPVWRQVPSSSRSQPAPAPGKPALVLVVTTTRSLEAGTGCFGASICRPEAAQGSLASDPDAAGKGVKGLGLGQEGEGLGKGGRIAAG